jgi:hypothetical protein
MFYRNRILSPPKRASDLQKPKFLNIYNVAGQDCGLDPHTVREWNLSSL